MPENTCFSRLLMLTDAVHQLRSKIAPKRRLFGHLTPLATKESLNSGVRNSTNGWRVYHTDTRLVLFGVRDYDAAVGRRIAKDLIWFDGRTNLYAYVANDPDQSSLSGAGG
jgi:RHS repeat-associated protein